MMFLTWFVFGFALLRLLIALTNLTARNVLENSGNKPQTLVSVLIPARNEAKSLPILLESLIRQSHGKMEIMVYDDESTDETFQVVLDFAKRDSRISCIKGKPLPDGWLGKNFACDQLSQYATGQYLLFLDADVETGPELVAQTVQYMERKKLSLLSIFPVQKMHSFGEWITVPLMNWILLTLLPLQLIRSTRWKSFSAANGQFMLFPALLYRENQFHRQVRGERVEDIEIMRRMKSKGWRVDTLPGNNQVKCRMYGDFHEAVYGFSKNVTAFFGNSIALTYGFVLLTVLGWIPFVLERRYDLLAAYVLIILTTRGIVAFISRQNAVKNMMLMPIQELSLILIVIQSTMNKLKTNYIWKGRHIG